jgi:hypothetical protein
LILVQTYIYICFFTAVEIRGSTPRTHFGILPQHYMASKSKRLIYELYLFPIYKMK